jgi:hypothetical protein
VVQYTLSEFLKATYREPVSVSRKLEEQELGKRAKRKGDKKRQRKPLPTTLATNGWAQISVAKD